MYLKENERQTEVRLLFLEGFCLLLFCCGCCSFDRFRGNKGEIPTSLFVLSHFTSSTFESLLYVHIYPFFFTQLRYS